MVEEDPWTRDVPLAEARGNIAALVREIQEHDRFIYLTHRGRRVAALMPHDVGETWRTIENRYWVNRINDILGEGATSVGWQHSLIEVEGGAQDD